MSTQDAEELKKRYDTFAQTRDYRTTASDFYLRELEIDTAAEYMADGQRVIDIGCGLGYAPIQYASRNAVSAVGLDYSAEMIEGARQLFATNAPVLKGSVGFVHGSVLDLRFDDASFDIVTTSRCLMALLDWELQKQALKEIHRVLRKGGVYVMMEGTMDGLNRLNEYRRKLSLEPIAADGKDRLFTRKFDEIELTTFIKPYFSVETVKRFGMYYFLTRVLQPLVVAPEQPRYDHRINEIAFQIAKQIPDYEGLGHLVAFVLQKR